MDLASKISVKPILKASKIRCSRSKNCSKRLTPCRKKRSSQGGGKRGSVAAKLMALGALISADKEIKADLLFEKTAQYIISLKTQVIFLQNLVEFYSKPEEELAVNSQSM